MGYTVLQYPVAHSGIHIQVETFFRDIAPAAAAVAGAKPRERNKKLGFQ
jgi:hypothetical protein